MLSKYFPSLLIYYSSEFLLHSWFGSINLFMEKWVNFLLDLSSGNYVAIEELWSLCFMSVQNQSFCACMSCYGEKSDPESVVCLLQWSLIMRTASACVICQQLISEVNNHDGSLSLGVYVSRLILSSWSITPGCISSCCSKGCMTGAQLSVDVWHKPWHR